METTALTERKAEERCCSRSLPWRVGSADTARETERVDGIGDKRTIPLMEGVS
jgi:hypothetical protein